MMKQFWCHLCLLLSRWCCCARTIYHAHVFLSWGLQRDKRIRSRWQQLPCSSSCTYYCFGQITLCYGNLYCPRFALFVVDFLLDLLHRARCWQLPPASLDASVQVRILTFSNTDILWLMRNGSDTPEQPKPPPRPAFIIPWNTAMLKGMNIRSLEIGRLKGKTCLKVLIY